MLLRLFLILAVIASAILLLTLSAMATAVWGPSLLTPTAENRQSFTASPTPMPGPTPAVLIGAGDISVCGLDGDDRTSALIEKWIDQYPHAVVFTAGDNAQSMGQLYEYTGCFHPTWGRFKDRIFPSPGNHDWYTEQGRDYFSYFGRAAGPHGLGYYSYDLGSWHIVSLNSNCDTIDCGEESVQAQWLRADLQQNRSSCTLIYWHHPLWSSGTVPISLAGEAFWRIASENGADVVINGHDHHYERFTPLDLNGHPNLLAGIRTFLVGTGGAWLFELGEPLPITEVADNSTHGVILFRLFPNSYEWQFIPVDGGSFTDEGSGTCY